MTAKVFRVYGDFCVNHPWEVIMAILTLTTCMLTIDYQHSPPPRKQSFQDCASCIHEVEYNAVDMIVMTFIQCLAILCSYYQFCHLNKLGSKYILVVAGIFTVFSSFVFVWTVSNFLHIDISDLKDALFFFLLLIDLSKTGTLAQIALNGPDREVKSNIAKGISILGPSITLDTIVETLVISVGTLSGVYRLETLSYIACLSVIVNYIIFMTFYPACLSLILELIKKPTKNDSGTTVSKTAKDEFQKSNPIVQRVKLIMSVGIVLVHGHRWYFKECDSDLSPSFVASYHLNGTEELSVHHYIVKWIALSSDHIVILILLLALVAKFVLFESKEVLNEEFRMQLTRSDLTNTKATNTSSTSLPPLQASNSVAFFLESQDDDEKQFENKQTQTSISLTGIDFDNYYNESVTRTIRGLNECVRIYKSNLGAASLNDEEVLMLVKNKYIAPYELEKAVDDADRGVRVRRQMIAAINNFAAALPNLPYKDYDYSKVMGACCENVIGYTPVPVGIVGPLLLDDRILYVPMATTEGCLVASTNRGSRALSKLGITSRLVADGMTRGPVVRFPSVTEASNAMAWIELPRNFSTIKDSFDASSRYARLSKIHVRIAGRYLFVRFVAKTGDAMGMNMLSKGTEISLKLVQNYFPNMEILSLSGNFCADKKPAAVNWIEGRGKSVVCEAVVPANAVTSILKTTVHALVDANISKNMIGSAIAGSIGGFNAHAANLVTAVFIATGQDPAQNVGSSNCMTIMEPWGENGEDLYISCTMPSIEIGTVGGGTVLPAQAACLEILGVQGPNEEIPGENANQLARIICGTVLAGELSLMAALSAGHLVKSHLRHNRSSTAIFNDFGDSFRKFSSTQK